MSNASPHHNASSVDVVFAQLNERDIEEFHLGYQCWYLRQHISALQTRLDDLQLHIAENSERMQALHPTAIELAILARLQSNGVSDVDLLDRMLERGELWLDRTMQRLDYFEQLDDFISDDYTQWCQHALEGAYDWIDSMLDGGPSSSPPVAPSEEEERIEATEEMFLQKLSSDEYDDASPLLETTLKRPAIIIAHPEDPVPLAEDISATVEAAPPVEEPTPTSKDAPPGDVLCTSDLPAEEDTIQQYVDTGVVQTPAEVLPVEMSDTADHASEQPEEPLSVESSSIPDREHPPIQESVEFSPATGESSSFPPEALLHSEEHAAPEILSSVSEEIEAHPRASIPEALGQDQQNTTIKRPNFIRRFIRKIRGR